MPITPFNNLRNPQSVGQTYLKSDGSTVTTGTGYAVIVRLNTVMLRRWEPCLPLTNPVTFNCGNPPVQINEFNVDASTPGLVDLGGSGIDASVWDDCCTETGHPSHKSYTAFISFDDWANSDLSQIAANPATWQKDEKLFYKFESKENTWEPQANGAIRATAVFSFSIIEVVDEAMYSAGTGTPVDNTISSQYPTYGEIPVGTIMATPGDPNCNGCTDLYENLGIKIRQGELTNQNPGYFLESKGPQQISGTGAGATITGDIIATGGDISLGAGGGTVKAGTNLELNAESGSLRLQEAGNTKVSVTATRVNISSAIISNYANNAAALAAGLVAGDLYRNGDSLNIVH